MENEETIKTLTEELAKAQEECAQYRAMYIDCMAKRDAFKEAFLAVSNLLKLMMR